MLTRTALAGALAAVAVVAAPAQAAPAPRQAIVQLDAGTTAAEGKRLVRSVGGRVTGDLHLINGLAAKLPAGALDRLQGKQGIRVVTRDARVQPRTVATREIDTAYPYSVKAVDEWTKVGYTGRGVGVAIVDTGIAGDLADFRVSDTDKRSRVVASAVTNPYATTASDTYGHGTHVAGIIAGNGNNRDSTDPLRGDFVGVAPNANLVSIKADDDQGVATILDVIYGIQFAVDHKDTYNIRVLNLSLESTQAQSYKTDPLNAAVESAWFSGIVVVTAAGNRGTAADAVHYAPGNDPYAISVGAIDDKGTKDASDDAVASWSSRGTTQDGFAKPDILAPGVRILSNLAPNSQFASMCPECVTSGEYIRAGGTSMSAPMVSGAIAVLLEAYPHLTPNQVKGLIHNVYRQLPGGIREVNAIAMVSATNPGQYLANQGLTPNSLIDTATGTIDYTRSSWSRSSWSSAPSSLTAGWSRSSWSCNCSLTSSGTIDPTRSSWSRSSWSTSFNR